MTEWTINRELRPGIGPDVWAATIGDGDLEMTMLTIPGPDGNLVSVHEATDEQLIAHAEIALARHRG